MLVLTHIPLEYGWVAFISSKKQFFFCNTIKKNHGLCFFLCSDYDECLELDFEKNGKFFYKFYLQTFSTFEVHS